MKHLRRNFCIVLFICDEKILLGRFKMVHGTLGMLDAILTFQDGADLEPTHRRHRQPLFSISRAWNMHMPPTNSQRLNWEASPPSTQ